MATTLQNLHQEFKQYSASNLSVAEFETLLVFFPAILVVAADGDIDHEEWIYINQLIKAMANYADEDNTEKLEEEYEQAIKFLIRELHTWEMSFVPVLQGLLSQKADLREEVTEVLYIVADASDGVSIALDLDVENL
jgi:hypothetical protein